MTSTRLLVLLCCSALASAARAQTADALRLEIGRKGSNLEVRKGVPVPKAPVATVARDREIPLEITCAGLDCRKLTVVMISHQGESTPISATEATTAERTSKLPPLSANQTLRVETTEAPPASVQLALELAVPPPAPAGTRALGPCAPTLSTSDVAGRVVVYVTPSGGVIDGYPVGFTDDDVLEVRIVGTAATVSNLRAVRRSAIRPARDIYIAGADQKVTPFSATEICYRTTVLGDFQDGRAEVAILDDATPPKTLGSFEFNVSARYSGIFSVGGIWTKLEDPTFAAINGPSGPVVSERGGERFLYAVLFTPFVQGKRTLGTWAEPNDRWFRAVLRHVNPTVGVVLNDLKNNAIVGATLDLPRGILVTAGAHVGRVTRLDERSGLDSGSALPSLEAPIPTRSEWKADFFWSVSIDLRAATQLLGVIASSAGQ